MEQQIDEIAAAGGMVQCAVDRDLFGAPRTKSWRSAGGEHIVSAKFAGPPEHMTGTVKVVHLSTTDALGWAAEHVASWNDGEGDDRMRELFERAAGRA